MRKVIVSEVQSLRAIKLRAKLNGPKEETVRDEAARRNLSIKKIRRERRDKANEDKL